MRNCGPIRSPHCPELSPELPALKCLQFDIKHVIARGPPRDFARFVRSVATAQLFEHSGDVGPGSAPIPRHSRYVRYLRYYAGFPRAQPTVARLYMTLAATSLTQIRRKELSPV
jgi:hypothetical protein